MRYVTAILESLYNLITYAGEAILALVESITVLPGELHGFLMLLGEPMVGFGVVITLALGALVLRIIVNII